jgi:hypothetical protein
MKTLNKILCVGATALTLLLGGCKEYRIGYSKPIIEEAIVSLHEYIPSKYETKLGIKLYSTDSFIQTNEGMRIKIGDNLSIGSDGGLGTNIGDNLVLSQKFTPAKYNISFEGNVNFEFNNEEIFERFKLGDKAKVKYLEVYREVYEDKNKDQEKELVERKIKGYKFIDAELIK